MISPPPSLTTAPWLKDPGVQRIFSLLATGGEEARIVGGAVRNALMGLPVGEIDFATTATPEAVTAAALAAGIKTVPTGIEHGTVTLVFEGNAYEVTTLRQDIATDGRHATVRFGRDWTADAERRDFTMNALSVDSTGAVHDPLGGYADLIARRVRFIGDADTRIAEDRLRILRFFRFHAHCGEGPIDPAGLGACVRARNDLRDLSAERVGQEMRRIVVAPRAVETVALMQETGIMPVVLGGVAYLAQFAAAVAFEGEVRAAPAVAPRLAALACRIAEDVARVSAALRLANVERARMFGALSAAQSFTPLPNARAGRALLYRLRAELFCDGLAHARAWHAEGDAASWRDLYDLPARWQAPAFPLTGRDVVGAGVSRGPAVGELLRAVEAWWIAEDFAPDEQALRRLLQQLLAAQQ
jgi:tRNA nucleotidyltransferase/poly(A) polymerase